MYNYDVTVFFPEFDSTFIREGKVVEVELILVVVDHVPGLALRNVALVLEKEKVQGHLSTVLDVVVVIKICCVTISTT
ncbi:hypothetical protein NQ317_002672 [Molorchus minor]|uniref:Uncharacterized protein n=1 Tax=Molorchus minor TaxID=1323400 RepID=A0ABQ9JWB8_9CUCU|nr:hypothetical protein NQ317_002672 [Molorchus minor]